MTSESAPRCTESTQVHTETVHTTSSHPWLTTDHRWVRTGQLRVGERVRRADSGTATVVALRVVPGTAPMYDLTVNHVHTFAVGAGTYVVRLGEVWSQFVRRIRSCNLLPAALRFASLCWPSASAHAANYDQLSVSCGGACRC